MVLEIITTIIGIYLHYIFRICNASNGNLQMVLEIITTIIGIYLHYIFEYAIPQMESSMF